MKKTKYFIPKKPKSKEIIELTKQYAKEKYFNILSVQEEFHNEMVSLLNEDKNTEIVTCIPARCGIGKTNFIKSYVNWCAHNNIGLVVVTDNLVRLNEIYVYDEKAKESIFMCEAETSLLAEKDYIRNIPVVLISTQKYFGLDEEQRAILFEYKCVRINAGRNKVIFDEMPLFYTSNELNVEKINTVDTLIRCGLDDTVKNKEEILTLFVRGREAFFNYIKKLESSYDKDITFFANADELEIVRNSFGDFFDMIEKHKAMLQKFDKTTNYVKNLELLKDICLNGGFYSGNKKREGYKYGNSFFNYKHNGEYFKSKSGKVKFFVFDATCDIHPLYQQEFIRKHSMDKYTIPLNLKIKIVNSQTSKKALDREKVIDIVSYIKDKKTTDKPLIFTYKEYEKQFKNNFDNVEHFGNIKGYNNYNDVTESYQIGINRFNPFTYFLMVATINKEYYEMVTSMTVEKSIEFFDSVIKTNNDSGGSMEGLTKYYMEEVLIKSVVADFEQNMFRTSIRNIDNTNENITYLFMNYGYKTYSKIAEAIEKRYSGIAEVEYVETPDIVSISKVKKRKTSNGESHAQKILKYLDTLEEGEMFKTSEMLSETGLKQVQLDKVKANNPSIKKWFYIMKTDEKGWYVKKNVS